MFFRAALDKLKCTFRASFRTFAGWVPKSSSGGRGHILGRVPVTSYSKLTGAYTAFALFLTLMTKYICISCFLKQVYKFLLQFYFFSLILSINHPSFDFWMVLGIFRMGAWHPLLKIDECLCTHGTRSNGDPDFNMICRLFHTYIFLCFTYYRKVFPYKHHKFIIMRAGVETQKTDRFLGAKQCV